MNNTHNLQREFEQKGKDAMLWLEQAKKLKISADVIRVELDEFIKQELANPPSAENKYQIRSRDINEYRIRLLSYIENFMMLTAFAFECLTKGITIAADPQRVTAGKLHMSGWKRGGHDLAIWAKDAKLSTIKIDLLTRLEEYSVWAGRYPIPTNINIYTSSKVPQNKETFYYPSDFKLIDELFGELEEQLTSVWRRNGGW